MQITAEITQTYDLLKFAIARSNGSNFSLQHNTKCPSLTTVKRQKRSGDRQENGKCTNATNRRSREACQPHFTHQCRVVVVYFVLPPYKSLGTSVASFTFCYVRSSRPWIRFAMCLMYLLFSLKLQHLLTVVKVSVGFDQLHLN